jgi:hypothetical protein
MVLCVVVSHVGVVSREWGHAKVDLLVSFALKFASCFVSGVMGRSTYLYPLRSSFCGCAPCGRSVS